MSERLAKIPQLDALRAIAAACIILYHFLPAFGLGGIPYGWLGVDLFFVISGYLITTILYRQRASTAGRWQVVRNFIFKRSLRLFPAYFAFITVFAVLMITTGLWSWDPGQSIWYYTYMSNILIFLEGPRAGHLTHLWSLAVEEQFYLIWPWIVLFLSKRFLKPVLIGLVILSFSIKSFSGLEGIRLLPFAHFDTLGMGALLGIAGTGREGPLAIYASYAGHLVLLGLFLLILNGVTLDLDAFKYGAVLLMTTSMVLGVIAGYRGVIGGVLDIPWMGHLGRISYGLYLYHMPIPVLLKLAVVKLGVGFPGWGLLMLSLSLTVIIAELSFRYLETPFLRLKERFDL